MQLRALGPVSQLYNVCGFCVQCLLRDQSSFKICLFNVCCVCPTRPDLKSTQALGSFSSSRYSGFWCRLVGVVVCQSGSGLFVEESSQWMGSKEMVVIKNLICNQFKIDPKVHICLTHGGHESSSGLSYSV